MDYNDVDEAMLFQIEEANFLLITENRKLKRDIALANSKLEASKELIKRLNKRLNDYREKL